MDGAIVVDRERHPDPARRRPAACPTPRSRPAESGTRHRTAERVAKQTGFPVISVSQSMRIIALYVGGQRYVLEDSDRDPVAGQPGAGHAGAVQVPPRRGHRHAVRARDRGPRHRPRRRRRASSGSRWCAASPRRSRGYVVELGTDGRLLTLQLDELIGGVGADRELVVRDYLDDGAAARARRRRARRAGGARLRPSCSTSAAVARALGFTSGGDALDARGQPARLPPAVQGAAAARRDRRPARRPLRRPAEAARRQHRRPHGRRGRRRAAGPGRPRGPVPARRVQHPRALRLTGTAVPAAPLPRRRALCTSAVLAGTPRTPATCPGAAPTDPLGRAGQRGHAPADAGRPGPAGLARWLARWPAPADLAARGARRGDPDWGRLGYPRRALRLHAAAVAIVERHGGEVPSSYADLLALPGVGAYTAAAVASFAFGGAARRRRHQRPPRAGADRQRPRPARAGPDRRRDRAGRVAAAGRRRHGGRAGPSR